MDGGVDKRGSMEPIQIIEGQIGQVGGHFTWVDDEPPLCGHLNEKCHQSCQKIVSKILSAGVVVICLALQDTGFEGSDATGTQRLLQSLWYRWLPSCGDAYTSCIPRDPIMWILVKDDFTAVMSKMCLKRAKEHNYLQFLWRTNGVLLVSNLGTPPPYACW